MMSDKIRWGILGAAGIARNAVIPAIHAAYNSEVVAVASRDLAKARAFAGEVGVPMAYGSYEEMLADPAIDAIYNPLPNQLHAEWAMKAADAGKPVLLEKPLTVTATEARQVVAHFQAAGLQLAEAFMYRFHPQTERVKQMVDDGAIGELHLMDSVFTVNIPDPDNIRFKKALGGGCILDLGCYPINIMRYLAGEPNTLAAAGKLNAEGVDVRAVGLLGFPNGASGTFGCDFQGHFAQYYDLHGTEGRIRVQQPFAIAKDKPTVIEYWHGDEFDEITIAPANQYQLMMEDFADALLNHRAPRFAPEEAVRSMEALEKLVALTQANPL